MDGQAIKRVLGCVISAAAIIAVAGCTSAGPIVNSEVFTHEEVPFVEDEVTMPTDELHSFDEQPELLEAEDVIPVMAQPVYGLEEEYQIGPGDLLEFRSFDDITLDSQIQVRYDGHISLPLIPDIKVGGLTRQQAIDSVTSAYGDVFQDPTVSLTVQTVGSKEYYVMGAVTQPGQYPYVKPISLLDAINIAGGKRVNTRGGDSFVGGEGQLVKAMIIRHTELGRQVGEFDLKNLEQPGPHQSETLVFPGDVVYVPEGINLVYIMGELRDPGVFELSNNMTLMRLLAQAGGFLEGRARLRQVVLMREIEENKTRVMIVNVRHMLNTGADIPLEAGDAIYIPQRRLLRAQNFVQQFTGTISPMLSLYRQALGAWYEADRLDLLYGDDTIGNNTGDIVALQALLEDLTEFVTPTPLVP